MSTTTIVLNDEQKDAYNRLCKKLPESITGTDLNVYAVLLAILCSMYEVDISDLIKELDIDTANESSLKSYSKLVGYQWADNMTVNANRVRLKFYQYRRKYRGTLNSIKNLVRASSNEEEYYSNELNSKITITEDKDVITVTLPDNMVIMRGDISEVRPVGVRIEFILKTVFDIVDAISRVNDNRFQYTLDLQCSGFKDERIVDWGLDTILNAILSRSVLRYTTEPSGPFSAHVQITKRQG
jgi:hypothetical protein